MRRVRGKLGTWAFWRDQSLSLGKLGLHVCSNSGSSPTGGTATPHSILAPRFIADNVEFLFSSTLKQFTKAERLPCSPPSEVIHLQPGHFSLSVFLVPLVFPPYLSFPSPCFLNPHHFRFFFPTVVFFGLTLQLYNFKLCLCVLAEKSWIHLRCSSLPACADAAWNRS